MTCLSKTLIAGATSAFFSLAMLSPAQAISLDLPTISLGEKPELPEHVDPADLLPDSVKIPKLPTDFDMPMPGSAPGRPVSCLQKGKLDIKRPSLPLVTCSETLPIGKATKSALQEACTDKLEPMQLIDPGYASSVVPLCPKASLGTCIGAKGGSVDGSITISNHYHYTPQNLFEWIKSRKSCEKSGGKWYGLGSVFGFF